MSGLGAMILIALLASGSGGTKTAFAENNAVTGEAALKQAVSLHEKLHNSKVEIPDGMNGENNSDTIVKAAVLGYINMEDAERVSIEGIRKQDMMNVLYKTVISYDDSFAVTSEEADRILNKCYDNAYIDDENRIAYAFMMKHDIISGEGSSEPNKKLTKESCDILIDLIYQYFNKDITINTADCDITIGSNIKSVVEKIGEPNRVDASEYGFEWYVYNADYTKFVMIGVQADRVCAVYTNNASFNANGVKSGDNFVKTVSKEKNENLEYFTDENGKIDAVLYNPRIKGSEHSDEIQKAKADEFIDMINAYRAKNSCPVYAHSDSLDEEAAKSLDEFKETGTEEDNTSIFGSYSVFNMYNEYLNAENEFITEDKGHSVSAGAAAYIDDNDRLVLNIVKDNEKAKLPQKSYTVSLNCETPQIKTVDEVTVPVIKSPSTENVYNIGDDVVISLEKQAAVRYHIEIFDVESDKYAVNAYIVTDATDIVFPAWVFKNGCDYTIRVSSVAENGIALSADDVFISYGSAYDSGVKIITPYNEGKTDDDRLAVWWNAEDYHDFSVKLYKADGELVKSEQVEDKNEIIITDVDPGEYYVTVTALRRGTEIEKAQDSVYCSVKLAEPVIEETILEKNDKYYFVYEDKSLGALYLYDEELVNDNGTTKKKIIKKQVKATKAYRELAANQIRREFTTGEPVLEATSVTASSETGRAIVSAASKFLGVPYVWGGTTPNGFDCSGLVQYVMKSLGINVSRTSQEQIKNGVPVSKGDLQAGDLVFFESNGDVHHVGIYVGNGMMLHAPRTGDVVKYQSIETPYYQKEYAGARRVY